MNSEFKTSVIRSVWVTMRSKLWSKFYLLKRNLQRPSKRFEYRMRRGNTIPELMTL